MHLFWAPLLGCIPIAHLMSNGCLHFIFNYVDDARKILDLQWGLYSSILTLKVWTPLIDWVPEKLDVNPMLVKFLGFPLEWWSKYCLIALGNRIGGFIEVSEEFKNLPQSTLAYLIEAYLNLHFHCAHYH